MFKYKRSENDYHIYEVELNKLAISDVIEFRLNSKQKPIKAILTIADFSISETNDFENEYIKPNSKYKFTGVKYVS